MPNWFEIADISKLDTPALVIFPERVKANIRTAIEMVGDISRLRPHIKTNKSPDAVQLLLDAGITKFKCATIAEAELLGRSKASDVLLAYQPLGPKLARFISLIQQYPQTHYSCLCDDSSAAAEQSAAFDAAGLKVPVYMDLNIGMNRTGIIPGEQAFALYQLLDSLPGIQPAGIHAYDGHMRDPEIIERTKKCNEAYASVLKLKKQLEEAGLAVPVIVAGGSPSFPIHAARDGCECSPGTFIYWDKGYSNLCPEQDFLPAAVLVTRVISMPTAGKLTTDLGHKSVAAENEITRRIYFLNTDALTPASQSEEHLVLDISPGNSFQTGDVLYGLPFHVCPTVALYERVYTVENNQLSGEWKNLARDRVIGS